MSQVTSPQVPSGSGLSVREGINAVLAALMSSNSGPSEPPNPTAFQIWGDTATNDLKIRNSSNTAWLLLSDFIGALEYDRVVSLSAGQKTQGLANLGILSNKANNGYVNINGLLIQWGNATIASIGYGGLSFPVAFPNHCYRVMATPADDASSSYVLTPTAKPISLTQFYAVGGVVDNGGAIRFAPYNITYLAIGD